MSDFKTAEWKKRERNYVAKGNILTMSRGEKKMAERVVHEFPDPILTISRVFETQGHGFMVVSMPLLANQILQGQVRTELLHLHPSIENKDDPAASLVEGAGTCLNGPCLEVAYERHSIRTYLDMPRYEPAEGFLGVLDYLIAQHLKQFNAHEESVPVSRQLRAAATA